MLENLFWLWYSHLDEDVAILMDLLIGLLSFAENVRLGEPS